MTATVQSVERRGVGVFISAGFVILLAFSQLYVAVVMIPRFSEIFQDMQVRPLPMLTLAVLNCRWALAGVDCICSLAAIFIVQRRASMRYLFAIQALLFVLVAVTIVALFSGLQIGGGLIQAR